MGPDNDTSWGGMEKIPRRAGYKVNPSMPDADPKDKLLDHTLYDLSAPPQQNIYEPQNTGVDNTLMDVSIDVRPKEKAPQVDLGTKKEKQTFDTYSKYVVKNPLKTMNMNDAIKKDVAFGGDTKKNREIYERLIKNRSGEICPFDYNEIRNDGSCAFYDAETAGIGRHEAINPDGYIYTKDDEILSVFLTENNTGMRIVCDIDTLSDLRAKNARNKAFENPKLMGAIDKYGKKTCEYTLSDLLEMAEKGECYLETKKISPIETVETTGMIRTSDNKVVNTTTNNQELTIFITPEQREKAEEDLTKKIVGEQQGVFTRLMKKVLGRK